MKKNFKMEKRYMTINVGSGESISGAEIRPDGKSARITFTVVRQVPQVPQVRTVDLGQLFPVMSLEGISLEKLNKLFPIVDPRKLEGHKVMGFEPKTGRQRELMEHLLEAIHLLPPFRANAMDPCITKGGKFGFEAGNMPAVGNTAPCYETMCLKLMPSKHTRIMTNLHRDAVLGHEMIHLVDEMGYSVEQAWDAVCYNSRALGHYRDSEGALGRFEPTGSRYVGAFSDLGNTGKVVRDINDPNRFYVMGGDFAGEGHYFPLASRYTPYNSKEKIYFYAVPGIVMDV